MRVEFEYLESIPEYGKWGNWTYGRESGSFGRSLKGMWADLDGSPWIGLETYEDCLSERFIDSVTKWRKLDRKLKRYANRCVAMEE